MKKRIKYWWTAFLSIVLVVIVYGQDSHKLMLRTDNNNKLILGADNYFSILGMQEHPISKDQISAFLYTSYQYFSKKEPIPLEITGNSGEFKIHPDSLGWVEFRVEINGETEKITVGITPLRAICSVGNKVNGTLSIHQFTAQFGMFAYMDMDGLNGRCNITKFELLRIGADGTVSKFKNKGGKFEMPAQEIIKKAAIGDLYIFRKIGYYCPQTKEQEAEEIFIEIE